MRHRWYSAQRGHEVGLDHDGERLAGLTGIEQMHPAGQLARGIASVVSSSSPFSSSNQQILSGCTLDGYNPASFMASITGHARTVAGYSTVDVLLVQRHQFQRLCILLSASSSSPSAPLRRAPDSSRLHRLADRGIHHGRPVAPRGLLAGGLGQLPAALRTGVVDLVKAVPLLAQEVVVIRDHELRVTARGRRSSRAGPIEKHTTTASRSWDSACRAAWMLRPVANPSQYQVARGRRGPTMWTQPETLHPNGCVLLAAVGVDHLDRLDVWPTVQPLHAHRDRRSRLPEHQAGPRQPPYGGQVRRVERNVRRVDPRQQR